MKNIYIVYQGVWGSVREVAHYFASKKEAVNFINNSGLDFLSTVYVRKVTLKTYNQLLDSMERV